MALDHDIAIKAEAEARILQQYEANTGILAMVDASAANYQLLENSLWTLQTMRALATAEGVQLDGIGQIVDLARNGLSDADYFTWLTAKILALSSDGSADRLLDIGALIAAGTWVLGEYFPASFLMTAPAPMANAALVASILSSARSAGVNGQMLYSLVDDADTFTFSDDDTEQASTAQGWSDDPGPDWESTGVGMTGGVPTCCAYLNGLWLIGGTNGKLSTSPDGRTWTARTTGLTGTIRGVAYGAGVWVIGGGQKLAYSANGASWTVIDPGGSLADDIYALIFANGVFALGADEGAVAWSTDGIHWTFGDYNAGDRIYSIAFGSGLFVFVGKYGEIRTIAGHGGTWGVFGSGSDLHSVAHGTPGFVAVGDSNGLWFSANGTSWASVDLSAFVTDVGDIHQVIWDPTLALFIAVQSVGYTLYSADGVIWYPGTEFDLGKDLYAVASDASGLRLSANFTAGATLMASSTDGINWDGAANPFTADVKVLAAGAGEFVAADTAGNFGISGGALSGGLWADVEQL